MLAREKERKSLTDFWTRAHDKFFLPIHREENFNFPNFTWTRLMIRRLSKENDGKVSFRIHIIWRTNLISSSRANTRAALSQLLFYGTRIFECSLASFRTSFTFFEGDIKCRLMGFYQDSNLYQAILKRRGWLEKIYTLLAREKKKKRVSSSMVCEETRNFHISNDIKLKVLIAKTLLFAYLCDLIWN